MELIDDDDDDFKWVSFSPDPSEAFGLGKTPKEGCCRGAGGLYCHVSPCHCWQEAPHSASALEPPGLQQPSNLVPIPKDTR